MSTKGKPVKRPTNLLNLKPCYTCECGEEYTFSVPAFCRKCGLPIIVEGPQWVKFDPAKWRWFLQRVNEIGLDTAIKELETPND